MAHWIYVEAIVTNAEIGNPGGIRFRHQFVEADSAAAAYAAGSRANRAQTYSPETETVNNYVVLVREGK